MKTSLLRIALLIAFSASFSASGNIVGYINRVIYPGDNLIANQLNFMPPGDPFNYNNSLNNILLGVADGTTFTKWDPVANAFLPQSVFNLGTHTWSINYTLSLGEGALVRSSSLTTNLFVGEVAVYTNIVSDLGGGQVWAPNYADGLHLIACPMPVGGPISSMFANVIGRSAAPGEWVRILDESTQTYVTATFDGFGWDNDPNLGVAHAAWFNLGPVNVPEPSSLALAGVAGLIAWRFRQRRK